MTRDSKIHKKLKHLWLPCTQMKDLEQTPPLFITKAKGVYLYDKDGNSYIDGISSWWVNLFGHQNKTIKKAIKKQLNTLDHIILAGFIHPQIVKLSNRLCKLTGFDRCFYADNGSSAIEIALKMSFHYQSLKNPNKQRPLFLCLQNSYHGETLGALSVGDVALYKQTYNPLLLKTLTTPLPKDNTQESIQEALRELKEILQKNGEAISAFIAEPLIQCAGNMHFYPAEFLREACKLCREYGILIIFDEIAVGFGRTGSLFAFMQCGVVPDILALSKGITGGVLPLSVVLGTQEIYDMFLGDYFTYRAFLHSHSYTGNAIAAAAANAVLDIFKTDNVIKKNQKTSQFIKKELERLENLCKKEGIAIANIRQLGMICAFDILGFNPQVRVGREVCKEALKEGVLLRPLENVIYFMPPYIITHSQIKKVFKAIYHSLRKTYKKLAKIPT